MIEYKENVDYRFNVNNEESNFVNIELLSGDFSGVVYRYGKVSFEEDKDNDEAHLLFGYEIINSNDNFNLEENLEFKNHIGDILTTIMVNQMNNQEG